MNLHKALDDFDRRLQKDSSKDTYSSWGEIKGKIEEMLHDRRAPHIKRRLQRPLVLIATPEIVSLPENMGNLSNIIKTGDGGGLADISAAVTAELLAQGVNVHVALPHYKNLFATLGRITEERYRELIRGVHEIDRVHFINDVLFERATRVYDENSRLDRLNLRKANAFLRGIIYGLLTKLTSENEKILIHCNDWMTGLLPAAAKSAGVKSLMTFHNIFTEHQTPKGLHKHGIDIEPFQGYLYFKKHPDSFPNVETHYSENEVDFMTSGLFASDWINTVSPTFLKELVEGEFEEVGIISGPMREMIRRRHAEGKASGILNAPTVLANPKVDPLLYRNYDVNNIQRGKRRNKLRFQSRMGLRIDRWAPIFYWPHRLSSPQKGVELMLEAIPVLLLRHPELQFAIVANGEEKLQQECLKLANELAGSVSYRPFSRELSQLGKAGADFIMCPSLYEPCGIPQVEGPRYGTLPIVRRTGGLADTVEQLTIEDGNGFVFDENTPEALAWAISDAVRFYGQDDASKEAVLRRAMEDSFERFNVQNTVNQYIEVYEEILGTKVR